MQWAVREGEIGLHVGYTASAKGVGESVQRNRAKRRLRACFDKLVRLNSHAQAHEGLWLNFVAKKTVLEIAFSFLEKDMAKALLDAGIKI